MRWWVVLLLVVTGVGAQDAAPDLARKRAQLLGLCFQCQSRLDALDVDARRIAAAVLKARELVSRAQAEHNAAAEQTALTALRTGEQTLANVTKRRDQAALSLTKAKQLLGLPDGGLAKLKLPDTSDDPACREALRREQEMFQRDYPAWVKPYQAQRANRATNETVVALRHSLQTGAPPPPWKTLPALNSGDVLLVEPDSALSKTLRFTDRLLSQNWKAPASHTLIYLKEVNGKRFFLDNQLAEGPRIITEDTFLERYGDRFLHKAELAKETQLGIYVAEPLRPREAKELWTAATEAAQKQNQQNRDRGLGFGTNYGLLFDDMVCSETSRWALIRAGRQVEAKRTGPIEFGPADFYDEQHFIVTPLGTGFK